MTADLVPTDAAALADAEAAIEQGYTGFLKVGLALAKIRDQKLYRATHATFADYCDQRWNFTRTHAYRLIEAGEVAAILSPVGDIPTNERHARALKPVLDEYGPAAAAKVMETAKASGPLTAALITEAAHKLGYGVAKSTVRNDVASVQNRTVEPVTITTTTTQHVDAVTGEILDPPPDSPPPPSSGPQASGGAPIVGLDGKTYQRPAQLDEPQFTDDERELLDQLKNGKTVVLNMRAEAHARLWAWASAHDLAARIDRKSQWGNPFILGEDGDRGQVIGKYATFYLPHKPQLIADVGQLKGKALGCWCAPERCHGDVLAAAAS